MTASFPTTASAPPASSTPSRLTSTNQFSRVTTNQQISSSRLKSNYDNRRYSHVTSSAAKRSIPQASITPNPRSVPVLSRIEMGAIPAHQLALQHQMSSPGRLQRQTALSSVGSAQLMIPTTNNDPLNSNRSRPGVLPPANVRNAIHRNAVSLNALSTNPSNIRGRSQNTSNRGSTSTRTTRLRQQSIAGFELQHATATPAGNTYSSGTLIFRNNPLPVDPPAVFFE